MPRREQTVGLVRCPTDTKTLGQVAAARGLTVRPADKPHVFYLCSSGRALERGMGRDLFDAFRCELDNAVRAGMIPSWSEVERTA